MTNKRNYFLPEWGNLFGCVFFCDLHCVTRKAWLKVIDGQEGIIEVKRGDLIGHLGVMGATGVTVSQDDVMEPVRNDTLSVHEVTDGLQHSLVMKTISSVQSKYRR